RIGLAELPAGCVLTVQSRRGDSPTVSASPVEVLPICPRRFAGNRVADNDGELHRGAARRKVDPPRALAGHRARRQCPPLLRGGRAEVDGIRGRRGGGRASAAADHLRLGLGLGHYFGAEGPAADLAAILICDELDDAPLARLARKGFLLLFRKIGIVLY